MKSFIVYDDTGTILRTGMCADNDFDLQAMANEYVIEGQADDLLQVVKDGRIQTAPIYVWSDFELNCKLLSDIRSKRNNIFSKTDWTQFPDSPLADEKKVEWATYRQALRDLPSQYPDETNIDNVVFPTPPEA